MIITRDLTVFSFTGFKSTRFNHAFRTYVKRNVYSTNCVRLFVAFSRSLACLLFADKYRRLLAHRVENWPRINDEKRKTERWRVSINPSIRN